MTDESKDNKKILIIEDDVPLRNVLREKLTHEGFSVLEANDGEEGLANAVSLHPDLILLDIIMLKMDGITMMRKLRQENKWGKSVPIILLTNLSSDDDRINKAIANDEPAYYLVKANYTINDLVEKIRERLGRKV